MRAYLSGAAFGDAGRTVVIEEGLTGPELSLLVLVSDGDVLPLAPAQDFKRVGDGDAGPNTGGMGAYSPVPIVDDALVDERDARRGRADPGRVAARGTRRTAASSTRASCSRPTARRCSSTTCASAIPECQVVVPRLASDLAVHCLEAARGEPLSAVKFHDDACVTVVLAAEGYPAVTRAPATSSRASTPRAPFPASPCSTRAREPAGDGAVVTAGGRVLDVTAVAPDARRGARARLRRPRA